MRQRCFPKFPKSSQHQCTATLQTIPGTLRAQLKCQPCSMKRSNAKLQETGCALKPWHPGEHPRMSRIGPLGMLTYPFYPILACFVLTYNRFASRKYRYIWQLQMRLCLFSATSPSVMTRPTWNAKQDAARFSVPWRSRLPDI